MDDRVAGRWHGGLNGELAARIAGAFADVVTLQTIFEMNAAWLGRPPTAHIMAAFQNNFLVRRHERFGAGADNFVKFTPVDDGDINRLAGGQDSCDGGRKKASS